MIPLRTKAEILTEQMRGLCPQFNGLIKGVCKAGVPYYSVVDRRLRANLYPCIHADHATTECPVLTGKCKVTAAQQGKTNPIERISDLFED